MTKWLLNSAVLAAGAYGDYRYAHAGVEDLRAFVADGAVRSGIGYPDTAWLIGEWTGWTPPVSRESTVLKPGDVAFVVRLRYRVSNPATKGHPVSSDPVDLEIARLERLS